MSDLREIQQKINSYNKEIQWKKKEIKKIEDKISTGGALNIKEEKKKLKDLASDGLKVEESLLDAKKVRNDYDVITNMLRDTGIKAGIIKKVFACYESVDQQIP